MRLSNGQVSAGRSYGPVGAHGGRARPRVNRLETSRAGHVEVGTRRLQVGCTFTYVAAIPTPVVFQVQPAGSWLGDRWWTFDPRNNTRRKGRVVIGRGRDASDVAMATTFGGPLLESMLVQAHEAAG